MVAHSAGQEQFLKTISDAASQCSWKIHAFVVIPDHVHLLVTLRDDHTVAFVLKLIRMPSNYAVWPELPKTSPNLAKAMTLLNTRKALTSHPFLLLTQAGLPSS